jgi:hypothetical protein
MNAQVEIFIGWIMISSGFGHVPPSVLQSAANPAAIQRGEPHSSPEILWRVWGISWRVKGILLRVSDFAWI